MTALVTPAVTARQLPAVSGSVDRAIRVSTAVVVLAVAGIAAYISYLHAYAVVREYGESGVTAQLEPATIDGLVYASSMVILYAARHRLPVPRLARWMLALGILASLAVNVAQGWSHGLIGAVVAAWPAVSLVGSYELLAWIIRTAASSGPDRGPAADQRGPEADHAAPGPWPAPGQVPHTGPGGRYGRAVDLAPASGGGRQPVVSAARADQQPGPGGNTSEHSDQRVSQADQNPRHVVQADQVLGYPCRAGSAGGDTDIDAAAVAAYRTSLETGRPLSERKLAGMFGKTSRRWARSRMAEARQNPNSIPVIRVG